MKIYQIYIPDLSIYVKYKLLDPEEIKQLLDRHSSDSPKELKKNILANVIFNMKSDVAEALRVLSRESAERCVDTLYNGCVMLNPGLDIDNWVLLSNQLYPNSDSNGVKLDEEDTPFDFDQVKKMLNAKRGKQQVKVKQKKISKQKFLGLEEYLQSNIIGQSEAILEVVNALKRSQAGLSDENRPLGIFLFAGASGVGKTHLANTLNKYLYGEDSQMVRIDCGEYQQKHDNQKLIGSPPGYIGHDEGGQLVNLVKKNPNTVVLLDEVEKAHADLWNTFLRVFEDGILTDGKGEQVNFCNTIIIMTTNLGNEKVTDHLTSAGAGFTRSVDIKLNTKEMPSRDMVERVSYESIKKHFRPEFINRIDKTIVFNHLSSKDYEKIAELEMHVVIEKLSKKGFAANYTDEVIEGLINNGIDTIKGARGLAKIRRDLIETPLADILIGSNVPRGSIFEIGYSNKMFTLKTIKPQKSKQKSNTSDEELL
jgi:ATP-dependent Clp protease ATP-binding subunit ClpA